MHLLSGVSYTAVYCTCSTLLQLIRLTIYLNEHKVRVDSFLIHTEQVLYMHVVVQHFVLGKHTFTKQKLS